VHLVGSSKITANKMQRFLISLFLQTLYMFQAVSPTIIRTHNCTYSFRYCQPILLLAATMVAASNSIGLFIIYLYNRTLAP